jgi:hypothetical protein
LSTVIDRVQPIRSAITVAGILASNASSRRIAASNASTAEPVAGREYRGGSAEASALATVFLEIPKRRAIAACDNRSDLCSRRISAQSSTLITPQQYRGVLTIHPSTTAQFSAVVDSARKTAVVVRDWYGRRRIEERKWH